MTCIVGVQTPNGVIIGGDSAGLAGWVKVGWSTDGYDTVGCGAETAYGALYVTRRASPGSRVRRALAAAAHHSGGVEGPFTILTLEAS